MDIIFVICQISLIGYIPIMPKDQLGSFTIPDRILERLKELPDVVVAKEVAVESSGGQYIYSDIHGDPVDEHWRIVRTLQSSKPKSDGTFSIHTIEARIVNGDLEFRCTCQGFRIGKKGFCRHTQELSEEWSSV